MGLASAKMGSLLRSLGLSKPVAPDAVKVRSDGFLTAQGADALFTKTSADVDGEECLHDCQTCTIQYPRKFEVEQDDKLYGEIKGWSRHMIVATGKTDWVRDVEDEKGSVMEAVGKHIGLVSGGRLMLSASNIPPPDVPGDHDGPYGPDRPTTVLLLPSFTFVDNVTPKLVPEFFQAIVNSAPTNTTPVQDPTSSTSTIPETLPPGISLRACPHKYLILLCSQATRDARCGQSAPLLRRELQRHLQPLGLYRDLHDDRPGGVGIYFISHVGGHKYSANMMVYRRGEGSPTAEAAQCIWLARVRPEDCENIVRYTVLQGKVVKPERQLRGGFDRQKGIVSW
jgi:(2Fe-2S) ferredoxin